MNNIPASELEQHLEKLRPYRSISVMGAQHGHARTYLTNDECEQVAERVLQQCQTLPIEGVVIRSGFTYFILSTVLSKDELDRLSESLLTTIFGDSDARRAWFLASSEFEFETEDLTRDLLNVLFTRISAMADDEFGYSGRGPLR